MNPHEELARAKKAAKLVDTLWADMSDDARKDVDTPFSVGRGDDNWWALLATKARTSLPSDITRAVVVLELCKRVNAERRFRPETCGECGGSGIRSVRSYGHGDSYMDGEAPCDHCVRESGYEPCELCSGDLCDGIGNVATPNGLYGQACAAKEWPELVRPAPVPALPAPAPRWGQSVRATR